MKSKINARAATAASLYGIALGLASFSSNFTYAQTVDPAVRLPQTAPSLSAPSPRSDFRVNGGPLLSVEPGGATFLLEGIQISGNQLFNSEQLIAVIAERIGTEVDFSQLEDIANAISQHYRDAGYPFARAYLPAQDVQNGLVQLEVLEGRYGEVTAVNAPAATPAMELQALRNQVIEEGLASLKRHFKDSELTEVVRSIDNLFDARLAEIEKKYVETDVQRTPNLEAQAFLGDLVSGEVIESSQIERVALIVDDIPGYTTVPVVRPSAERGAGDLEVRLIENDAWVGSYGVDNFGSKSSGRNRTRIDLRKSRNFIFGDQLSFTGLVTDESTWLSSLSYSLPVNASGLRLQTSLLFSRYELGKGEFAGLADGETQRASMRFTYPWLRSQAANITFAAGVERSRYTNVLAQEEETYSLDALPLSMNFDWRDSLGGGAVTYGTLSAQFNSLVNDPRVTSTDSVYGLYNLRLVREQRLGQQFSLLGRLSLQEGDEDTDSSQFMSLGGVYAVRAFPLGEFSGHSGVTFQGELSYHLPQYSATPYLFVDAARADRVTTSDLSERRSLSGYGLGLRFARLGANMDFVAAWADKGGDSVAEPNASSPRLWFSLSSSF